MTDELLLETDLVPFLAALTKIGGRWTPVDPVRWVESPTPHPEVVLSAKAIDERFARGDEPRFAVTHAIGRFECQLEEQCFTMVGTLERESRGSEEQTTFSGLPLSALLDIRHRLVDAVPSLNVRIWGGPIRTAAIPKVAEDEVVIPVALAQSLYPWLDRFWRLGAVGRAEGLAPRRGVLLAGPPGTGKTQLLRHLVTRYPAARVHIIIASREGMYDDPFGELIKRLQRPGPGAIVILEDLDRMLDSGMVTREYLLNCLDGMLQLPQPVLWIATANQPELFDPAILERPGRFDRIIRFALPEADARRRLLAQFLGSRAALCDLEAAVGASDGLTGAALRVATEAAVLAYLDGETDLNANLLAEIATVADRVETGETLGKEDGRRSVAGFQGRR